jgi:transposase-like protein
VVAHAVHETRRSEVIGLDVGEANTETFLTAFVRGLAGVQLAISGAYQGLNAAVMALAVMASFDLQVIDPP